MTWLTDWTTSWASLYANSPSLRTIITFVHLGALIGGGGLAIATDRSVLAPVLEEDDWSRRALLDAVGASHRLVIVAVVLMIASGMLMLAADVDTYLYSRMFWLKMALFAMLLGNGAVLTRAERRALGHDASAWRRLRRAAIASIALWFLTTLAGVALPNIG